MITERGLGLKGNPLKQGWENSDFPILCESCLGDNPYVRMLKTNYGKECKICYRPFTSFRWKAGTKGRYKETMVCQTCAKLKNTCQTCLFDLDFGLSIELRDKLLEDEKVEIPTQMGNREFWIEKANQSIDELKLPYDNAKLNVLQKLQRLKPNYKRNEAHVCTFYLKGECIRGSECPYLHSERKYDEKTNIIKNIQNRYMGIPTEQSQKYMLDIQLKKIRKPKLPADVNVKDILVKQVNKTESNEKVKPEDNLQDISDFLFKNEVEHEKVLKLQKYVQIQFKDRYSAETFVNYYFNKVKINDKIYQLFWDIKHESSDEEGLLIPGKGLTLSEKVKPPTIPPPEYKNNVKDQHQLLLEIINRGNQINYPSMNPNSLGGKL